MEEAKAPGLSASERAAREMRLGRRFKELLYGRADGKFSPPSTSLGCVGIGSLIIGLLAAYGVLATGLGTILKVVLVVVALFFSLLAIVSFRRLAYRQATGLDR